MDLIEHLILKKACEPSTRRNSSKKEVDSEKSKFETFDVCGFLCVWKRRAVSAKHKIGQENVTDDSYGTETKSSAGNILLMNTPFFRIAEKSWGL